MKMNKFMKIIMYTLKFYHEPDEHLHVVRASNAADICFLNIYLYIHIFFTYRIC